MDPRRSLPRDFRARAAAEIGGLDARVSGLEAHGSAPARDRFIRGDGSTTTFTVRHSRGSRWVDVLVWTQDAPGGKQWTRVQPTLITHPDEDTVTVTLAAAPAAGGCVIAVG